MGQLIALRYSVRTYGVLGYLDWSVDVRSVREAYWVARRWLRSKSRHDPEAKAAAREHLPPVKVFPRRVHVDLFSGQRYSSQLSTKKSLRTKLICYNADGELEIVLYLANIQVAINIGTAWAGESPGNKYRIPVQITDRALRKWWLRSGPPWDGTPTSVQLHS